MSWAHTRRSTVGTRRWRTPSNPSTSSSTRSAASCSSAPPRCCAQAAAWSRSPKSRLSAETVETTYFVVEPNRDQLVEIARLVDDGTLRPAIDSVYPLAEASAAFERSLARGKRGKVVLRVGA